MTEKFIINDKSELEQLLLEFKKDLFNYNIPGNFRVGSWKDTFCGDLYKQAKVELNLFLKNQIPIKKFNHPDCVLRNIIKLWPIDKKHKNIKRVQNPYKNN